MPDSKAPVPKFASFRPKTAPQAAAPSSGERDSKKDGDNDEERVSRRERSRERRHKRHDDRHREHHEHGKRDRSRERKKEKARNDEGRITVVDAQDLSKELFENASDVYRVDRKGDRDNLRFGRLHAYSVPPYRRIGYGAVLGALRNERIDRSVPEDKGIVLVDSRREGRTTRSLLQKQKVSQQRKLRLVRAIGNQNSLDHTQNFIQLPRGKKRKRSSESPAPEYGEVDYRSIEGKAKGNTQQPVDSDLEFASSSSDDNAEDDDVGRAARLRGAELSRRTKEHPQDLDAWQALIEHQRAVLGFAAGDISYAQKRTLADIRISIYEQALETVKSSKTRATLTLGMLDEGAKFWEAKKLSTKWEETLRAYSNEVDIWTAYLNFVQSSATEFRYERCKEAYVTGLAILGKSLVQAKETADRRDISRNLVYVFLRLTSMMRDAGYHEFALALWQAVLEIHFFRSAELQDSGNAIAEAFEEFWESEVPRLGEEGAKGWLNYSPDRQDAPEPVVIEIAAITSTKRLWAKFAEAERDAALKLALPGRSADEAGEDDPYHIVLFNDVQPVLFPHMLRVEDEADLVLAFLRFAGLPPLPSNTGYEYDAWWLDPMLPAISDSETLIPHFQITTGGLFAEGFEGIDGATEQVALSRRALRCIVDARPEDDVLAEYYIALEYRLNPTSASKIAKKLLKTRSSSLRLYNCYAVIESRMKDLEAGTRIFATAIGMADSLAEREQRLKVLLYRTWIWEALRADVVHIAIGILLSVGGDPKDVAGQKFTPATELRVTRWLQDGRDAMLSTGDVHLAVQHAELLALLAYFKNTRAIEAALRVFDETEEILNSRKLAKHPAHEALHQFKSRLLDYHLKSVHIWQPALLRNTLAHSITLFPSNTLFLTAYSKIGPDLTNIHSSHSLISDTVLASPTVAITSWSFALHTAQQLSLSLGGTPHATRAAFERALVNTSPRHNTHIWTQYLQFEVRQQKDYTKARDVFLRGLRELPWAKWWVVNGLGTLGGVTGFDEASRIWGVLAERELRGIVSVEEVIEAERERRRSDEEKGGVM